MNTTTAAIDDLSPRFRRDRLTSTIGAACLTFCVSFVVAFGLLVPSGTEHFGISVSAYLIQYTLLTGVSGLCFTLVGRLTARFGIRRLIIIGGIITTLSIYAMSLTSNLYVFYFFAALHGIGWAGCTLMAATIVVNGWHLHERKGSVLGLVLAGNAVGGVVWGLLIPAVVAHFGWSGGMQTLAIASLLMLVLPGVVLIKNPPVIAQQKRGESPARLPSLRSAGLIATVLLLALGTFCLALEGGTIQILPTLFENRGIDATMAGLFVSIYALGGILTKPLFGFLYDRLGHRGAATAAGMAFLIGFPWLALSTNETSYFIIVPLISLALTTFTVMVPLIISDAVASERFADIYGIVMTVGSLGLAIATPLWGLSYDLTGTFTIALFAASGLGTLGMALLLLGRHRGRRLAMKQMDAVLEDAPAPRSVQ